MVNSAVVCWKRVFLAFASVIAMISGREDAEFILSLSSVSLFLRESAFVYQQFRVFSPSEVFWLCYLHYLPHRCSWRPPGMHTACVEDYSGGCVCVGLWLVCLRLGPPFQFPHRPSWWVTYHPVHPVPWLCLLLVFGFHSQLLQLLALWKGKVMCDTYVSLPKKN